MYHRCLRIAALTLTLTLLFVSGIVHPVTSQLSTQTGQYLASAVGASASVAPTDINTVTAALTEQQVKLDQREAALSERELALGLRTQDSSGWLTPELATWLNSALLFIILVLLVINYALDLRYRYRVLGAAVHNN